MSHSVVNNHFDEWLVPRKYMGYTYWHVEYYDILQVHEIAAVQLLRSDKLTKEWCAVTRWSAWLVLSIGVFLFLSGLVVTLTASGAFEQIESDLLEYPLIGDILSGIWDTEMAGRSLAGEWARSVPFVQAFAIIWTLDGVFLTWLGLSTLLSLDDWQRR